MSGQFVDAPDDDRRATLDRHHQGRAAVAELRVHAGARRAPSLAAGRRIDGRKVGTGRREARDEHRAGREDRRRADAVDGLERHVRFVQSSLPSG